MLPMARFGIPSIVFAMGTILIGISPIIWKRGAEFREKNKVAIHQLHTTASDPRHNLVKRANAYVMMGTRQIGPFATAENTAVMVMMLVIGGLFLIFVAVAMILGRPNNVGNPPPGGDSTVVG